LTPDRDPAVSIEIGLLRNLPERFWELSAEATVSAFGVRYGHVVFPDGGDLYVTQHGWPYLPEILPHRWYSDSLYVKEGTKLPGSTGHVYHIDVARPSLLPLSIVIKFSRVAQHVPIIIDSTFPESGSTIDIAGARFNSPMEEFGLVEELRRSIVGPCSPRIRPQHPLAIYVPAEKMLPWQSGRNTGQFAALSRLLAADQEDTVKAIELDIARVYVLIYRWIEGENAEVQYERRHLGDEEFHGLAHRVEAELRKRGFQVLDNKPKHFILRASKRTGGLLRDRHGELYCGLVDFELLQRTPDHHRQFQIKQRSQYLTLQASSSAPLSVSTHLSTTRVFGVEYLYGSVPDGGRLWVVGSEPRLFDYFVPERWRRTARFKLAMTNEIYRTRTRDGIEVVYRRSRVGSQPHVDPIRGAARHVRDFGFNSPFEEIAIAGRVRQMGIPTVTPLAIFRTGHKSMTIAHLRDSRPFERHAHLKGPDAAGEPILQAGYDFYTIWDCFRGLPPAEAGGHHAVALSRAHTVYPLPGDEWDRVIERARRKLGELGLPGEGIEEELSAFISEGRAVYRNLDGEVHVVLSLDGIRAYEYGLLDEERYRRLVHHVGDKLRAADFEALNLSGHHILLTLDIDGRFLEDEQGLPRAVLCNLELIRGLYRPIQ
jgi:hypothetical protein